MGAEHKLEVQNSEANAKTGRTVCPGGRNYRHLLWEPKNHLILWFQCDPPRPSFSGMSWRLSSLRGICNILQPALDLVFVLLFWELKTNHYFSVLLIHFHMPNVLSGIFTYIISLTLPRNFSSQTFLWPSYKKPDLQEEKSFVRATHGVGNGLEFKCRHSDSKTMTFSWFSM